eukprot:CAMPEP_0197521452 /NCGR_PEP_ID=MMETSP1318-20131121/6728_1 /TAXON_ID=552666 /ORGANISM="Partenskyella glossopodia, Strain RCC365" /LENGTH=602 /DNA_ID=CAMNT_0043073455 /DNA_START=15 /DNA_END=1823 /DNA_ORIENTATION=-
MSIVDPHTELDHESMEHALRRNVSHDSILLRLNRINGGEVKDNRPEQLTNSLNYMQWANMDTHTLGDLRKFCRQGLKISKDETLQSIMTVEVHKRSTSFGDGKIETRELKGPDSTPLRDLHLTHGCRVLVLVIPAPPALPPLPEAGPPALAPMGLPPPPVFKIDAKTLASMDRKSLVRVESKRMEAKKALVRVKKAYKNIRVENYSDESIKCLKVAIHNAKMVPKVTKGLKMWINRAEGYVESLQKKQENEKKAKELREKKLLSSEEKEALKALEGKHIHELETVPDVGETEYWTYYEIPRHEVHMIRWKEHQEWVAAGKTAKVYRALWHGLEIAWKVLQYRTLMREAANAFMQEVEVLKVLSHENVVRMIGVCTQGMEENNGLCLATEWCAGGGLDMLCFSEVKMTMKDVLTLAIDIARGMEFIHAKGLIHRDLKLANIMLTFADQAKVGDFGTALFKQKATGNIGTQGYQAPEVFLPPEDSGIEEYHSKIDVFSFGICLWHLMTRSRKNPLTGRGVNVIMMKKIIKSGKFLPWPDYITKGGKACEILRNLVERCVAYSPEERPTFKQAKEELESLSQDEGMVKLLKSISISVPQDEKQFH